MARKANARLLDGGDIFPALQLELIDGKRLALPSDLSQPFNAIIVNRGFWCPYCVAQLVAFQSGLPRLEQEGIGVVSFSAEPRDTVRDGVARHGLKFPVGHSVSVDQIAETLGCYYEPSPTHTGPHLHAAGFVLGPEGKVLTAVYSSGAIGRLSWQDVLGFVRYVKAHS